MKTWSALTPHYTEDVTYSLAELQAVSGEESSSLLTLLKTLHPEEWSHFVDRMELHKLRCKEWFVQATIGVRGDGLYEGLKWLSRAITANKRR